MALAVALAAQSAVAVGAPLEAYGRLPSIEQVVVSPDGGKLAFVSMLQGQRALLVDTVNPPKGIAGLKFGEMKVRDVAWADNSHILVTTSSTGLAIDVMSNRQEWAITQVLDIATSKARPLLMNVPEAMNVTAGLLEPRTVAGRATVFVAGVKFVEHEGKTALFAVDLPSGRASLVPGVNPGGGWVLDERGEVIAQAMYREDTKRWSLQARRGGRWAEIYGVDAPIDAPHLEGLGRDSDSLLIRTVEDGRIELRPLSLKTGALGAPLSGLGSVSEVVFDPANHRVIGARRVSDTVRYAFFDRQDQDAWTLIARSYPNEMVELVSWSEDRTRVVVRVTGPRDGLIYVLVDLNAKAARPLGDIYEGIKAGDIAPVQAISYVASDGRRIPAVLTLPNGRPAKGLPLIVLPHGGPAERDNPGFDWWAQALASRGYAVLQPQFRGSDGFGWDHLSAGFGQWGRKMQTDLSDGVHELAAKGIVDPARVCIVGASYGGYAALAGVSLQTGVYRCAVSIAGLSDLRRQLGWTRSREQKSNSRTLRYWDRFMGADSPNDPALDLISPIKHVDKIEAPVLLIHGSDDTVVPFEQSRLMAEALQRAQKPVELIRLKSEDHWLSRSETRLQMLQETVKFLETKNPPG